jgi:cytochrome b involved in lipid metabolism
MDQYSHLQVASHNSIQDAWIIYENNVYDISDYLEEESHPGGIILLEEYLGKDITQIFTEPSLHHHSNDAFTLLEFYKIGKLK